MSLLLPILLLLLLPPTLDVSITSYTFITFITHHNRCLYYLLYFYYFHHSPAMKLKKITPLYCSLKKGSEIIVRMATHLVE
jgi:hypothetical protein